MEGLRTERDVFLGLVVIAVAGCLSLAPADLRAGPNPGQETRAEAWTAIREQKAADIAAGRIEPEGSGRVERVMSFVEEGPFLGWFAEDFTGFHPVFGDLATGSGLALGIAYAHSFVESDAFVHASASLSTHLYRRFHVDVSLPLYRNLEVEVLAQYQDFPQMLYFGLGPDTPKDARTQYRLVDTLLEARARYRMRSWLFGGIRLGSLGPELGSGTLYDYPPTDSRFDETTAPGLESQPAFLALGAFVEVDYRDVPRNAREGGFYGLYYTRYDDRDLDRYGFDRVDLEATQLIPFFDKRRVIVLHGRLAHTDPLAGNVVPFYLMPYLGGDDTARGYFEYRFHDRDLIALNAEYRWESFAGLDMALFLDAGNVAGSLGQIRLRDLKTSYGIGFRFSTRGAFALRVDIGTGGGEGTRLFVKFSNAF